MNNCTPLFYVDVITYPCSNISQSLSVKGAKRDIGNSQYSVVTVRLHSYSIHQAVHDNGITHLKWGWWEIAVRLIHDSWWYLGPFYVLLIEYLRRSHLSPNTMHDGVIKWKHFPRYWPFVRGIHRYPVNSPHKGQWRGALIFTLICARINDWVKHGEAGDLRRHRAHYDVIVMYKIFLVQGLQMQKAIYMDVWYLSQFLDVHQALGYSEKPLNIEIPHHVTTASDNIIVQISIEIIDYSKL